ncbi:MAG: hypothetical protein WCO56_14275 [Verrucomicrobiota bacterium]
MKKNRPILLLALALGVLVGIIGAIAGFKAWREFVINRQEERAFAKAQQLLRDHQPNEVLVIVQSQARTNSKLPWSALELDALTTARQLPRLTAFYERHPERVLAHEEASLLVARAYFHAHEQSEFEKIRRAWANREQQPHRWLALDSDALALRGKPREAEALLRSRSFSGPAEATRLVRLALLTATRKLSESWALLDRANQLDPRNPDIHSFRAQILESLGKFADARVEYVAALVADPKNPLVRDQLAEFYQRQGNCDFALKTWQEALNISGLDFMQLKFLFWNKLVAGSPNITPNDSSTSSHLTPLAVLVRNLPADHFWDENAFTLLPNARVLAQERPEVFWLRLLELLHAGRENEALDSIRFPPPRALSLQPELLATLDDILSYRLKRPLSPVRSNSGAPKTTSHQFLVQLKEALHGPHPNGTRLNLSPELDALLHGRNALAAAFLAVGWREAALQFANFADSTNPSWFAYGIAQSLRYNRKPATARDYLAQQKSTPELELLRAELLLADNQTEGALQKLAPLALLNSDVGQRAAWLLALAQSERREFATAAATVLQQPRLAQSVSGQEILARLALFQGRTNEVEKIYHAIAAESIEAKTWLAQQAFANRQWKVARQLTEELLLLMPDELQLRENLLTITKAEATR